MTISTILARSADRRGLPRGPRGPLRGLMNIINNNNTSVITMIHKYIYIYITL